MSRSDQLLAQWYDLKQQIRTLTDQEAKIREKIRTAMTTRGLTTLKTERFQVTLKIQERESLSKKNCPTSVWSQYCVKSKYPILRLISLQEGKVEEDPLE